MLDFVIDILFVEFFGNDLQLTAVRQQPSEDVAAVKIVLNKPQGG